MSTNSTKQGSVVLLVLVLLLLLTVIMVATTQWLSRQAQQTVDAEQVSQAFSLADTAIYYATWLFDPAGGNQTPATTANIVGREVRDSTNALIGTYDLIFSNPQATTVDLQAVARDAKLVNKCQTIMATLQGGGGVSTGLLAYWPLNDGPSGAQALDTSGSNNHGTLTSMNPPTDWVTTTAPTAFLNPYALDFDGVNDRVAISDIDFTNAMSGSLWVRFNAVSPVQILITTQDLEYQLQMRGTAGSGKFRVQVATATGTDIIESTTAAATDVWYHLGWTYDGTNLRLFVNGTEETTVIQNTASGAIIDGTHGGTIGAAEAGTSGVNGLLDEVRVYNRALGAPEVQQLSSGGGQSYWRVTNWRQVPGTTCP